MRYSVQVIGTDLVALNIMAIARRADEARPVLELIRDDMIESTKEQFSTEGGHGGTPWPGLSDERTQQRGSSHPILRDTDELFREATKPGSYDVKHDLVEFDMMGPDYAMAHQEGYEDGNIPARPFIVMTDRDKDDYRRAIEKWIMSGLLWR